MISPEPRVTVEPSPTPDPAGGRWDSHRLDLAGYLARIGYGGDLEPTARTLTALHRAHVLAIPFDNLEIWLGRPILLDLDDVQDKLVRRRHGGYCYEHTLLFAAVLDRLGFEVTGLGSRVRMGGDQLRAITHALVKVTVDGEDWLADVGFGSAGLLEPIPLRDGARATQGGWTFGLTEEAGGVYALRSLRAAGWFDLHAFTTERRYPPDYAVMNHYTSTHPRSPFTGRLVVARTFDDRRLSLVDGQLTTTRADGVEEVEVVDAPQLPTALREVFGYDLDAADADALSR